MPANEVRVRLPEPLALMQRGALILPDVEVAQTGESIAFRAGDFNPDAVRGALLLFDRLDRPKYSSVRFGPDRPEGLEEWPGFQHTLVEKRRVEGDPFALLGEPALFAFKALELKQEGLYSFARDARSTSALAPILSPMSGLKIRLEDALPLPDRSVPYEDVLNFKERRYDELTALRHHMDDVVLEVKDRGFSRLAETVAVERFLGALSDYKQVMSQQNFLKKITTLEVSYSVSDAIKAALVAAAAGVVAPAPALAVLASGITINVGAGFKRKGDKPSPFEYVFQAGQQL